MVTAVSTFSGCGGSSEGMKQAGIDVKAAVEFIPAAADCYHLNHPDTKLYRQDIRTITGPQILEDINLNEIDLLEGSPPCSPFSMSGKRDSGWNTIKKYSDTEQRSDDLFEEVLRLASELKPRAVLFENVPGLAKAKAKGYLVFIADSLKQLGYTVQAVNIEAAWLGVPQKRKRLYIIGFDSTADSSPINIEQQPAVNLRDTLKGLEGLVKLDDRDPRVLAGDETVQPSIERFAIYRQAVKLSAGESSDKYFNLCRPDERGPCFTVTAQAGEVSAASVIHPSRDRKFSILELKRIMGFSDDYRLTGNYQQKAERLGRAVCPPVYKILGRIVKERLNK